jgi:hypothetical protein
MLDGGKMKHTEQAKHFIALAEAGLAQVEEITNKTPEEIEAILDDTPNVMCIPRQCENSPYQCNVCSILQEEARGQ